MLLALIAGIGCGAPGSLPHGTPEGSAYVDTLTVQASARVTTPGTPTPWTVTAVWGETHDPAPSSPGTCRRAGPTAVEGRPGIHALSVDGPSGTELTWDDRAHRWASAGPMRALDPAWSVGGLRWIDADDRPHRAVDSVRFGGLPMVSRVVREREGAVSLAWDPETVANPEILVTGPAGVLVCGARADGVTLPWWAVPARGGEVVLRSTREQSSLVDGVLLRVRTTIEQVVPLDEPDGVSAEEKPPEFAPYTGHGRTRITRARRGPYG